MNKEKVTEVIREVLKEQESFLVDVSIGANNKISVYADSKEGMTIQRLKMINRSIEKALDRDAEDFDLTISSPGLDQPLKVFEQYELNIGRMLRILTNEEETHEGRLKEVTNELVTIVTKGTKKVAPKTIEMPFSDIKETKIIIEFK